MFFSVISISWMTGALYTYDFIRAMRGSNSPYMCEFYGELKTDIKSTLILAVGLGVILMLSSTAYSLSNIDIGYTGAPFLYSTFIALQSLKARKVAGNRLPIAMTRALLFLFFINLSIYAYYLVKISSNEFSAKASLWIQCTLLLSSFCWCIFAHQMVFILKKQRMEISPVIVEVLESFPLSRGIYREMEPQAEKWNKLVFQKSRQQVAGKKRRKKKR
ncbi:hypothetical protein [Pseudomonas sp. NPDC089401]|uniref:hypothetical protein n=1 Tax=Pseudomonas sp. NPDC089401 TaxID=3364462 RepID=UPI003815C410